MTSRQLCIFARKGCRPTFQYRLVNLLDHWIPANYLWRSPSLHGGKQTLPLDTSELACYSMICLVEPVGFKHI